MSQQQSQLASDILDVHRNLSQADWNWVAQTTSLQFGPMFQLQVITNVLPNQTVEITLSSAPPFALSGNNRQGTMSLNGPHQLELQAGIFMGFVPYGNLQATFTALEGFQLATGNIAVTIGSQAPIPFKGLVTCWTFPTD